MSYHQLQYDSDCDQYHYHYQYHPTYTYVNLIKCLDDTSPFSTKWIIEDQMDLQDLFSRVFDHSPVLLFA